jgi:uncharacterized protein
LTICYGDGGLWGTVDGTIAEELATISSGKFSAANLYSTSAAAKSISTPIGLLDRTWNAMYHFLNLWQCLNPIGWLDVTVRLNEFGQPIVKRDEVLAIVAAHREQLQAMGVKSLNLFGSVARNEARPDSDVDFLVEFDRPIGLFEFIEIRLYLQDILGCSVDMGTLKALREHLREPVFKDAIHAF